MFSPRLSVGILLAFLGLGVVLGTRPELDEVPSELFEQCEEDSALELIQKKVTKFSKQLNTKTTTTTATMTTSTTTTTDVGPAYLITSSRTDGAIYSWTEGTPDPRVLIPFAGHNPSGIALDPNLGYLYYTDPVAREIVRYELEIRDDVIKLFDQQPVSIAKNVDADSIAVNEFSNIFWTDPVSHSIKKMYKTTIDLVTEGLYQPDQLTETTYMEVYKQLNTVPSLCYNALRTSFAHNCSKNLTCNACQELHLQPYIYTLYSDMGHPSGMQVMPGNKMAWGNMVDGYHRGSVVEAENEPTLAPGETAFRITALTYLWDSVFNFISLPDDALGTNEDREYSPADRGFLFLSTNGTLGMPPINEDVVGAVIAITPNTTNGVSEAIPIAYTLDQPRSLVWNGHEKLYIADNWGIHLINSGMMIENTPEIDLIKLPGASGLLRLGQGDPCYPMMVSRGSMDNSRHDG